METTVRARVTSLSRALDNTTAPTMRALRNEVHTWTGWSVDVDGNKVVVTFPAGGPDQEGGS